MNKKEAGIGPFLKKKYMTKWKKQNGIESKPLVIEK